MGWGSQEGGDGRAPMLVLEPVRSNVVDGVERDPFAAVIAEVRRRLDDWGNDPLADW